MMENAVQVQSGVTPFGGCLIEHPGGKINTVQGCGQSLKDKTA